MVATYNFGSVYNNYRVKVENFALHSLSKYPNEPRHEISNNVLSVTSKASGQPLHTRSLTGASTRRLDIL